MRQVKVAAHLPPAIHLAPSAQDPHPALRFLCRLDPGAALGLLRQALAGWDALEAGALRWRAVLCGLHVVACWVPAQMCCGGGLHRRRKALLPCWHLLGAACRCTSGPVGCCSPSCAPSQLSPTPSHSPATSRADLAELSPDIARQAPAGAAGRTVAQAVVDAVVALLETGAFSAGPDDGRDATGGAGSSPAAATARDAAAGGETEALRFLAAHLASNRAAVPGGVLLRVLGHLAAAPSAPGAAGGGGEGSDASDMSAAQREAVFCDVVSAAGAGLGAADREQVWPDP